MDNDYWSTSSKINKLHFAFFFLRSQLLKFAWASVEKQYISIGVTVLDVQIDDCSLDFIFIFTLWKIQN